MILPKASEKDRKSGWVLDPKFLINVKNKIIEDEENHYIGLEEIEEVCVALDKISKDEDFVIKEDPLCSTQNIPDYDPGLLNGFGGGDVNWWFDYIRQIVADANEYWREQIEE